MPDEGLSRDLAQSSHRPIPTCSATRSDNGSRPPAPSAGPSPGKASSPLVAERLPAAPDWPAEIFGRTGSRRHRRHHRHQQGQHPPHRNWRHPRHRRALDLQRRFTADTAPRCNRSPTHSSPPPAPPRRHQDGERGDQSHSCRHRPDHCCYQTKANTDLESQSPWEGRFPGPEDAGRAKPVGAPSAISTMAARGPRAVRSDVGQRGGSGGRVGKGSNLRATTA
jgi:hypothetical protein